MLTVTLQSQRSWLCDPTDPTTKLNIWTRRGSDGTDALDGEYRQFPQDLTQLSVYDSGTRVVPVTFAWLTGEQYRQIISWKGRLLLLRTTASERYYGTYLAGTEHVYQRIGRYDYDVAFRVTSYAGQMP